MMRARTARRTAGRRGEEGIALVMALLAMMTLLLAAATSLLVGSAGMSATRNYRGAGQVHFVAESGISEALQTINGPGATTCRTKAGNKWGLWWGQGRQASARSPASGTGGTRIPTPANT